VLKSLPALVWYLRNERPRLMISAMAHTNIVALWAQAFSGVCLKSAVSVQNTMRPSLTAAPTRSKLLPFLMRRFYSWADVVAVVSQGAADDLHEVLGRGHKANVRVIHNPVVTPHLFARKEQGAIHPWLEDGGAPVVLGVGRLARQKNFEALIAAFARVRERRPARLLILGEGEDRAALETQVAELGLGGAVDMPGFAENPYSHMAKAALFVLSSRWEGLPSVLIEAMACGCPVVSVDCPSGPKEILEDGRWGPLVPEGNFEALADAIVRTLDSPLPASVLTEQAMTYGVERIVDEFVRELEPSLLRPMGAQ
jgi:glycosyltransferase involved in cell wall biosynthesis